MPKQNDILLNASDFLLDCHDKTEAILKRFTLKRSYGLFHEMEVSYLRKNLKDISSFLLISSGAFSGINEIGIDNFDKIKKIPQLQNESSVKPDEAHRVLEVLVHQFILDYEKYLSNRKGEQPDLDQQIQNLIHILENLLNSPELNQAIDYLCSEHDKTDCIDYQNPAAFL